MTLLGTAETFKADWMDGLVSAYGRTLRRVPGAYGVVGRHVPRPGKVAVIIGGGCGHYPAFAGLVGDGLADAAVIGDVFTSPSAEQVYRTARAAEGGAGVLFSFGNYAGDIMHFGLAGRRLAGEGIDNRTVLVTDDVATGSAEHTDDRRGVAGGLFVFKVAGAAAERGDDLAGVEAAARKANAATRTFGIAFDGCTLPGQTEPLFTVDAGHMELGLGIHGEPGVRTAERVGAGEIADILVDAVLAELPAVGDGRVAVVVNGLGRTKYEELFVCYGQIHRRLAAAGLRPHRPEVGEFVTSLDMAGLSLSLMVLDEELATLYDAPCDTPAFRSVASRAAADTASDDLPAAAPATGDTVEIPAAGGGIAGDLLAAALEAVEKEEDNLGRLDAVAGDGDHGLGMVRGLRGALAAARSSGVDGDDTSSVGTALLAAGTAMADAAGGASGAVYGVLLTEIGAALARSGERDVTLPLLTDAVDAAYDAVVQLGGAKVGDKTMLDALDPFRRALRDQAGASVAQAWPVAAIAAADAAAATAGMVAKTGRAARLGNRGRGSPDPGATSLAVIAGATGTVITARCGTPAENSSKEAQA